MTRRELLINEIEYVPEPLVGELIDFVRFLKSRFIKGKADTAISSESSLGKDWLKPEEDEAWRNL